MSVARERPAVARSNGPWIAAAVVAAILLGGFGIWAFQRTRPEPATVTRRDIAPAVTVAGQIVAPPGTRADVGAPFEAPVEKVLTSVGQNVRRGEVLAELSYPATDANYEQARQAVRAAETAYANAKRDWDKQVQQARRDLDQARSAERSARKAAPAPAPAASDTANGPASDQGTGAAPAPPGPAPDAAAAGYPLGEARTAAEQSLAATQAQRDAALAPYQQSLDMAREAFRRAQAGEKMTQVRAPISGTVLALNAQPGQVVKADGKTPVATIVNLDELQLQGPLPAAYAAAVKPRMEGTLTVAKVPNGHFGVRVHSIITTPAQPLKPAGYAVILHVKNERGLVKPEMKGRAAIQTGERRSVLAVPADAVQTDHSGRPVVSALRGGKWQPVVVETGISDGQYTEIKSGLQEGETVQVKQDLL